MGIVNVTPDSFSDGGRFVDARAALKHALRLVEEGADLVDVGGESTRPGALPVSEAEEAARVLPVLERLREHLAVPISVDTRRAATARAALSAGASVVNDVSALGDPGMAEVVAEADAGLVLMHMRGTPRTMQRDPWYADLLGEIAGELEDAVLRARATGVRDERMVVDPGLGFGKTAEHNLELLARLGEFSVAGLPVLIGPSRKAFLGSLLGGLPPEERAIGTAAACVVAFLNGARIFRVHDVRPVRQALDVAAAIRGAALPRRG